MEELHCWIGLNMAPGVGKTLFYRLLRHFGSIREVLRASAQRLREVEGIGEKTAGEIVKFDFQRHVERECRLAEKLGARIVPATAAEYPEILSGIYDPPPVLYCKGRALNSFPVTVGVVGTRQPTSAGAAAAEKLCLDLAQRGVCIVSGLARGIDTIAHKSALRAHGTTIAVLGCGLSHVYPPENLRLQRAVEEHGVVVSEFPLSTKPDKMNFPARNRIISGLSQGVLVVEAGEKSGALITAQFALEQGRDVFAVPGSILSPKSLGSNQLIKSGAKLVDGVEAVIEELPEHIRAGLMADGGNKAAAPALSPHESRIMNLLVDEEKHIDVIIESSKLSPAEVSATLVQLELKGLIRQRDGKRFAVA